MVYFTQALEITLKNTNTSPQITVDIADCEGFILAENVFSDIEMPPFQKSMMDGFAVRSTDCQQTPVNLKVLETIPAGSYPKKSLQPGQASKIMTGAPVPEGADAVQMVEKTEQPSKDEVTILETVSERKHIANKGEIMKSGQCVIEKGMVLTANKIGLLASIGKAKVNVYRKPKVAILATGSELVEIEKKPGIGQIRNSNGHALYAQVMKAGAEAKLLGIVSDEPDELKSKIEEGLQFDVLLISGGVSMGEYDFVENVLSELSVHIFYDKVNIKPGKPTVFGKKDNTLVFGLPGNPVSASTIFELLARPALRRMMGYSTVNYLRVEAVIETDFNSKTSRECYHPALLRYESDKFFATPITSSGSADILAFSRSNAFIVVKKEKQEYESGEYITAVLRNEFWQ